MTKENINAYVSDLRRSNMAIYLQLLNLFDNIRSQALKYYWGIKWMNRRLVYVKKSEVKMATGDLSISKYF
jgi:hypothetical protein